MRHLLSSFEILYHVIPQLQIAHFAGYFNLLSFVQSIYSISALQRMNCTRNPYCTARLAARIKVIRVRVRNILMPASINSIVFFFRNILLCLSLQFSYRTRISCAMFLSWLISSAKVIRIIFVFGILGSPRLSLSCQ